MKYDHVMHRAARGLNLLIVMPGTMRDRLVAAWNDQYSYLQERDMPPALHQRFRELKAHLNQTDVGDPISIEEALASSTDADVGHFATKLVDLTLDLAMLSAVENLDRGDE